MTTSLLSQLFAEHTDLLLNDLKHALGMQRRVIDGPPFCVYGLMTEDDVVKIFHDTKDFFVEKLKTEKFQQIEIRFVQHETPSLNGLKSFFQIIIY